MIGFIFSQHSFSCYVGNGSGLSKIKSRNIEKAATTVVKVREDGCAGREQ